MRIVPLALVTLLLCAPATAAPIVYQPYTNDLTSGFFIGNFVVPNQIDTVMIVAQRADVPRDVTQVSGAVMLSGPVGAVVTYALYNDAAGIPGASLTSVDVSLTDTGNTLYGFDFPSSALTTGTYWLVASSLASGVHLPIWPVAVFGTGPGLAWMQDGGPWTLQAQDAFGYALSDTSASEARDILATVPEPSTLLLSWVALGLGALIRRRVGSDE